MTPVPKPPLWLRAEHKRHEARVAVVPADAARLVAAGFPVTVEDSAERAFPLGDYVAAGCAAAPEHAWRERAPDDAVVVGLKELDPALGPFRHRHVHFAHAFKGQRGWRETLRAFAAGGGTLLDLEYLVDGDGRRVAAFGERAGFVGAALGLLALAGQRRGRPGPSPAGPLAPWPDGAALVAAVRDALAGGAPPRVLVVGARGRSGRGALALCEAVGARVTAWDVEETAAGGPFDAVREHEALVSCVFVDGPLPPFTTPAHLARPGRTLRVVADVGCDPFGTYNPLPIYAEPTSLETPVRRLVAEDGDEPPLDLVAIDHLPSLLPRESSEEFSARLLPHLLAIDRPAEGVWGRAAAVFDGRLGEALAPAEDGAERDA